MLNKDAILSANDLPTETVDVPEWGGQVVIRSMTGKERDEFEQSIVTTNGKSRETNMQNIRARLCALTMVDEAGNRLFDSADAEKLGGKSAKALDRVFAVAQKLNGLSSGDVDELAGN
jgi:hypothetical protein